MRELTELVPGKRYRIQHKLGLLYPRLGIFMVSYLNPTHNDFNTIIMKGLRFNTYTRSSYSVNHWAFYESGEVLLSEQYARGLCDRIPEDCAGIIQDFLTGRRLGPSRYPIR